MKPTSKQIKEITQNKIDKSRGNGVIVIIKIDNEAYDLFADKHGEITAGKVDTIDSLKFKLEEIFGQGKVKIA